MTGLIGLRAEHTPLPLDAEIIDHGTYRVLRTPSQPTFHDGNLIEVAGPFDADTVPEWVDTFRSEFSEVDGIAHIAIWWEIAWVDAVDDTATRLGAAAERLDLDHEFLEILELGRLTAPDREADVAVRPAVGDEFEHVGTLAGGFTDWITDEFWRWRVGEFRRTAEAGRGDHWLAWDGDEPIATAGLYHRDGLGSVQDVITRADRRGRGVAGTLLHTMLASVPVDTRVVIVVEPGSTAAALYRRLGFEPHSHLCVVKHRRARG